MPVDNTPVDPDHLTTDMSPAIVDVTEQGQVFVADTNVRDSGWLWVRYWDGSTGLVPPHRVRGVEHFEIESYGGDGLGNPIRIADEDWRERAKEMQGDEEEIATDGGTDVAMGEFPVVSGQISDPNGATAYEALAVRVDPSDHPRLERAGFHSPQTQFVLYSPGGRPLSDYDEYQLARDCPGADTDWIIEQLQALASRLPGAK